MKKKLLITFDYELYLGKRSGNIEECLIQPTNKILNILNKYEIKSIFFVDTTYLLKIKEFSDKYPNCKTDLNNINNQIIDIVNQGHYVFPHIHPHWSDAIYNEKTNQWDLSSTRNYRFGNIAKDLQKELFNNSVKYLESLIKSCKRSFKIDGFRAGGWCIQPFSDFRTLFIENNILYDFSVLTGFYQFTKAQYFDFSDAPLSNIYRFEDDVCIENNNGQFCEFSISSIKIDPGTAWLNKLWNKVYTKLTGDHTHNKGQGQAPASIDTLTPADKNGKNILKTNYERIAVELLTIVMLKKYYQYFKKYDYMHVISHPKMITDHNLKTFDKLLRLISENFQIVSDYQKIISEK